MKLKIHEVGSMKKLVVVNADENIYKNAIIFTLGHPYSDYPDKMILDMANEIIELYNAQAKK